MGFIPELVAVIRNQIPGGRKAVLEAYGDVLFRGWRDASGTPCAYAVEHDAIQDLMTAAIHAAAPDMAANLRAVLSGLHRQKACTGVDAMLCRLYEPILLRACTAPNAAVRTNALELLADAFPLNDPEVVELFVFNVVDALAPVAHSVAYTGRRGGGGCAACPAVWPARGRPAGSGAGSACRCRAGGAAGAGPLLGAGAPDRDCGTGQDHLWWVIDGMCVLLVVSHLHHALVHSSSLSPLGKLAFDGAAPAVRVAVLQGALKLLDNPLAQPILKVRFVDGHGCPAAPTDDRQRCRRWACWPLTRRSAFGRR